ncbi:MAG: transglutaminase domain-containing protein [Bacteroidales bacterium]|nr:transglutaminase domain-containing protein [Bacteroidales bacterium]
MKNTLLIIIATFALLFSSCSGEPKQKTFTEKEALEFLYAYMPLGDSVDYSEDYYRECVHYAFLAKQEMPWGNSIPEREFKHFVVPVRVNNENLDRFRATYYEELKGRVKDLSLYDAVLEVNHWCHEHVNYKGSDSRTSAPMATIKTSWGRCGEESTLLVTALRTVGIPARQVYTPRWAHCDDNHAWVEAWVDGQWHFLGACEPEPVLDLGWFNEPASRTLLLHTRVFGDYDGPEEVISRTRNYTEINVVDNYGKTAKTTFTVVDENGTPQANLPVEFKIYNYAEFCTVVTKMTDENGQTWLTSGLGTMMAYAAKDGKFGYQVFKAGENENVTITLDHDNSATDSFEFDMVPPAPTSILPEVTPEMRTENDRRCNEEDALRNAYIKSCKEAQNELIANTGNKTLCRIYEKTWGNYQTIADFVAYAQGKGQETKAVQLLSNITDKDLRDISFEVLRDHFDYECGIMNAECGIEAMPDTASRNSAFSIQHSEFIISPRISNEMIVPWRKTFTEFFSATEAQKYHDNPHLLVDWVKQNIFVDDNLALQRIPISPMGVLAARKADRHSRDIFFVAMARSLGIAAQINPVNGNVQYFDGQQWVNVTFEEENATASGTGYLDIHHLPIAAVADPKYYTHFSIKKWDGNSFRLLAYDAKDPGIDDGMMLSAFEKPTPLDEGFYILTAGIRLDDGTALTHSQFFTIKAGETTKVSLVLRDPEANFTVIGDFYSNNRFTEAETGEEYNFKQLIGNEFYILGLLDQGSEPTTHAVQDISAFKTDFERSGLPLIFLFADQENYDKFKLKNFSELPNNVTYGFFTPEILGEICGNLNLDEAKLPIFIIANNNSEVVFAKQGYTIGLGEQMLKVMAKVK